MREIALHIMDVAENGISAGGDCIEIEVKESTQDNLLCVSIKDNGRGVDPAMLESLADPFVTTRKERRVGLGLSLLKVAAKRCGGEFGIKSRVGKGTTVTASFGLDHIDRSPLGDMGGTISMLIMGNPNIDIIYRHVADGSGFTVDTREIRKDSAKSRADPVMVMELSKEINDALSGLRNKKGDSHD